MFLFSLLYVCSYFTSAQFNINSTQITDQLSNYDSNQLSTCVWLSGAAYCGKEKYQSMILAGPGTGFIYKDTLYDPKTDLQGYTGVLPSTKSIYAVIRGSSSVMNWLDDFEVKLVPYTTFPECNCYVHNGFYRSALGIKDKLITSINGLRKTYPSYNVIVSGHSYGASCGQLLAMELVKQGIPVQLYDYGQPRVGDKKYASFSNSKITNYWRTTHNKDTVPHVPPIEGFGYYHSCQEIFEDSTGKLTVCSNTNCEDPKCADQFSLTQTNTDDHSYYLQHHLSCEASTK
jgi:predicted lipase